MTAVQLEHGARTDVGRVREVNEDAYLARPPVFVVADGMGGHEGGDVASAIVVEEFAALADRGYDPAHAAVAVVEVLDACRQRIATYAEQQRARGVGPLQAGTTVVAALLAEHDGAPAWLLANLGDSRAYRVEGGSLEQVTVDHSVVQELVDTGLITEAAAVEHPERHVITRSLGGNQHSEPDLFVLPVAAAPRLVLCSDGISGMLDHEQMRQVLATSSDPALAADALLAAALDAGGRDNATVVVVDSSPAAGDDTHSDLDLEQRLGALP
ncbi:protein phosphatase 2C domain-containing protein [uncultured Nocardioides sp.]|uniref:PP2C family protein-serine/threonine phosphatase n=1 Tax=uncultured Nocardioides sp. TaxID=198441 RepID=UPI000C46EB46|nr:protein phosphatase [Nocardioides sp.]